jgi:gluconokinase
MVCPLAGARSHLHYSGRTRIDPFGLTGNPIETLFDLIEFDEGRDPVATKVWDSV